MVLGSLSKAAVIHLATHASLNADEPLKSLICLSDKDLTVGDLLGLRSAAELVVLSACESGVGGKLQGDQILGLAYVLLRCGSREVIASLWRVDDDATEVLMSKFHEHRSSVGSAAALAAAMSWIRSIPKWSAPYYWAGFVLLATGDSACRLPKS
jgi:CHAT domain-containing protein